MTKISSRQLLFFLAVIAPLGKMIIMPAQLVVFSKNDLLLSTLINAALQTGAVFLAVFAARHQKSLSALLAERFGTITAKIVCCILSLFLLYAALLPIMEQKLMVQNVFYDTLPSYITFAPFYLFSVYLCYHSISRIGRAWDFLMPLVVFSLLGIFIFAAGEVDFGALLPIGGTGAKSVFTGAAYTTGWFFDSAMLLSLVGKIDYKKGLAAKSALFYAVGSLILLLFLAFYYGIFSDIAPLQLYAFAKISKYFSAISVLGRIDYLFIHLISIAMAFYCAMPLQASCDFLKQTFGDSKPLSAVYAVGVNLLMLLLSVFLTYSFSSLEKMITQTLFWIFPIFCLALPAFCLFLGRNHAHSKIH